MFDCDIIYTWDRKSSDPQMSEGWEARMMINRSIRRLSGDLSIRSHCWNLSMLSYLQSLHSLYLGFGSNSAYQQIEIWWLRKGLGCRPIHFKESWITLLPWTVLRLLDGGSFFSSNCILLWNSERLQESCCSGFPTTCCWEPIWSSTAAKKLNASTFFPLRSLSEDTEGYMLCEKSFQWEFQDPKKEVLYHLKPYNHRFMGEIPSSRRFMRDIPTYRVYIHRGTHSHHPF